MKDQVRKDLVNKFYHDNVELMTNLYSRWQEEKEFEDIADYGNVFKPLVEAIGGTFIKMTKRPFGFTFTVDVATYQMKHTATSCAYKRIG